MYVPLFLRHPVFTLSIYTAKEENNFIKFSLQLIGTSQSPIMSGYVRSRRVSRSEGARRSAVYARWHINISTSHFTSTPSAFKVILQ